MKNYIDKQDLIRFLDNLQQPKMPITKGFKYISIEAAIRVVSERPTADVVEREKIDKAIKNIKNIDLIVHDGINHYYKSGEEVKAEVLVILKLLSKEI